MAGRKDKNTIDYFPHYVNSGKTLFIIETKYGLEGYAAWFKILEMLGKSENHFIDCTKESEFDYLDAKINLKNNTLKSFLELLAKLGAIHKELWENKIIWSGNFIKNIEDVYKRRSNSCMYFNDLCKHKLIKCKRKYDIYGIYVSTNTQSKLEESKLNKKNKQKKDLKELSKEEKKDNPKKLTKEKKEILIKKYKPYANLLSKIIKSKININHTNIQINNWAFEISKIINEDGISIEKLKSSLKWYKNHCKDQYCPVINSGKALREKFIKLNDAIIRDNYPKNNKPKNSDRYKEDVIYREYDVIE